MNPSLRSDSLPKCSGITAQNRPECANDIKIGIALAATAGRSLNDVRIGTALAATAGHSLNDIKIGTELAATAGRSLNDIKIGTTLDGIRIGTELTPKADRSLKEIGIGPDPASKMEKALHDIQIGADPTSKLEKFARDIQIGTDPASKMEKLARDIQIGADPTSKLEKFARDIQIGTDPASKMEKALRAIQTDPASQAERLVHDVPSGAGLATTWFGAVPVAIPSEIKIGAGPSDGAGRRASAPNPSEFSIPGYDVGREIGAGGFGRVFEARERSELGTLRAVKFIDPSPFRSAKRARAFQARGTGRAGPRPSRDCWLRGIRCHRVLTGVPLSGNGIRRRGAIPV